MFTQPVPRVAFIGDSITQRWPLCLVRGYEGINLGMAGQSTVQVLRRFRMDALGCRPQVIHIMAGTNDIAGNSGSMPAQATIGNILAMVDLARRARVGIVVGSICPAREFPWSPTVHPSAQIAYINRSLERAMSAIEVPFADYAADLDDGRGAMRPDCSDDGVHPNLSGYRRISPTAIRALNRAANGATRGQPNA